MKSVLYTVPALLLVSGCYLHTNVKLLNPAARRPPTCAAAVSLFTRYNIGKRQYVELALIKTWAPADLAADVQHEHLVQQQKAAELGANGLILSQPLDWQSGGSESVAIFIPADSARALQVCRGSAAEPVAPAS